jgi:hypothetical protein
MVKKRISFHPITREIRKTRRALRKLRHRVTKPGKKQIDLDLKSLSKIETAVLKTCISQTLVHHLQYFVLVPKKKK